MYRLENYSSVKVCTIFWAIIRPAGEKGNGQGEGEGESGYFGVHIITVFIDSYINRWSVYNL